MNKKAHLTKIQHQTLYLEDVIGEESWFDDVTPKAFKADLLASEGDILIWLNSTGGDCIAVSQIYTMPMDWKGQVTVKVDSMATSLALLMVHNSLKIYSHG